MNKEELSVLMTTLRGLGDSIAALALVVEGFPARIDANVSQLREELTTRISSVTAELGLRSADASQLGATVAGLEVKLQALAAITADNAGATDKTLVALSENLETSITRITLSSDTAIQKLADRVEGLDTNLSAAIEAVQSGVAARLALETGKVGALEMRTAQLEKDSVSTAAELAVVLEASKAVGERVAESALKTLGVLDEKYQDVCRIFNQRCDTLDSATGSLTSAVSSAGDAIASLIKTADATGSEVIQLAKSVGDLGQHVDDVSTRTEARVSTLYTRCDAADEELNSVKSTIVSLGYSLKGTDEEIGKAVEELVSSTGQLAGRVNAELSSINSKFTGVDTNLNDIRVLIEETASTILKTVDNSLDGMLTVQRFDGVQTLNLAAIQRLEDRVTGIDLTPAISPEQMAELRVAAVTAASEAVEKLQPEFVQPTLDVTYGDEGLVFEVTHADGKVQRTSVPISTGIRYLGVYESGTAHRAGDAVSHKGSLWVATEAVTGEPGKDYTGWKLAVKCGRDGKDSKARVYIGYEAGRVYREADFLRVNNRLWQCAVASTNAFPEPSQITSSNEWTLIGGVH